MAKLHGEVEREMAREAFADHVMRREEVVSHRFQRKDGASHYWFTLTWTPGHLTLAGDLGELTLCHYHALRHYEGGIRWALSSDFDYLMSKTSMRREYDRDGTLAFIMRHANEPVVSVLDGRKESFWRKDPASGEMVRQTRRVTGFRHELQVWRRTPLHEREDPEDDPRAIRLRPDWKRKWDAHLHNTPIDDLYDIPDCWIPWVRIWRKLRGRHHRPGLSPEGPEFVLKAANRWELKSEIAELCASRDDAIRFCMDIGLDDYYGDEKWPSGVYWKFEAIQHGCRMILDAFGAREARDASVHDNESQAPNGAVARELLEAG